MTDSIVFELIKASLFSDVQIETEDWHSVFKEMREQTVAVLPFEWLKKHLPSANSWLTYCHLQQGQWIRVMHLQDQVVSVLEENGIPCVIIKGAAAAMYYPHPSFRSMGDVDILVRRGDIDRATTALENNGFTKIHENNHPSYHLNFSKDGISLELHRRLPAVGEDNEKLLTMFERGIDEREWIEINGYKFPVLPSLLNGLVLIFHIKQHLGEGLGLRQIVDWMMYIDKLPDEKREDLNAILLDTGMCRLARTATMMCQKYLGLKQIVTEEESLPYEKFMTFIMEKGNFGRKAGIEGKAAAFSLSSTERGGFFHRLQVGGLDRWSAAKKHPILRPFAWIYQSFRIIGILIKNRISLEEMMHQRKKGIEQKQLIESLGLRLDQTVQTNSEFNM